MLFIIILRRNQNKNAFSTFLVPLSLLIKKLPSEKATWETLLRRSRCTEDFRLLKEADALNESLYIDRATVHPRVPSDSMFWSKLLCYQQQYLLIEAECKQIIHIRSWQTRAHWPVFINKVLLEHNHIHCQLPYLYHKGKVE